MVEGSQCARHLARGPASPPSSPRWVLFYPHFTREAAEIQARWLGPDHPAGRSNTRVWTHCGLAPRFFRPQVFPATPCLPSPPLSPWGLGGIHPPFSLHRCPGPWGMPQHGVESFLPASGSHTSPTHGPARLQAGGRRAAGDLQEFCQEKHGGRASEDTLGCGDASSHFQGDAAASHIK